MSLVTLAKHAGRADQFPMGVDHRRAGRGRSSDWRSVAVRCSKANLFCVVTRSAFCAGRTLFATILRQNDGCPLASAISRSLARRPRCPRRHFTIDALLNFGVGHFFPSSVGAVRTILERLRVYEESAAGAFAPSPIPRKCNHSLSLPSLCHRTLSPSFAEAHPS